MASLMRTIEVDFEVHQLIEANRRGFDDPANAVLRRLLRIDGKDINHSPTETTPETASKYPDGSWTKRGVHLDSGAELKVSYAEVEAYGRVDGGRLMFDGKGYDAPSPAVMEVVAVRRGKSVSINGWKHLYVRESMHGSWFSLDQLRLIQRRRPAD